MSNQSSSSNVPPVRPDFDWTFSSIYSVAGLRFWQPWHQFSEAPPPVRANRPVVAVNPTEPDNIVFVSTRFHPLPELEPVGRCFLTVTLDRGTTWNNVTADFPLGATPKCGEPQVFADANGTFYLLNNQVFSGLEDNNTAHPQLSQSIDRRNTSSVPSVTPLHMQGANSYGSMWLRERCTQIVHRLGNTQQLCLSAQTEARPRLLSIKSPVPWTSARTIRFQTCLQSSPKYFRFHYA
ncbi:hypothetical protein CSPX01_03263 [Colletotrichum filicis]|nr:hypothetical protein CSPX01_03263 [Colletotrichum filicis]